MCCRGVISGRIGELGACVFFSSRRRHTRYWRDWSSDVCSSDLGTGMLSLDTAHFPYSYYLLQVTGRIEENWMRPQGDLGRVVVYFRIKRDGSIVEIGRASCRERV